MDRNYTRHCDEHDRDYEDIGGWRCRECHNRSIRQRRRRTGYKAPKIDPIKQRQYNDKKCYGLTPDESDRLRSVDACQVCGGNDRLVIDHCHTVGTVRGVLCTPCNLILGHAKDNPDTLRALASYLER